MEYLGSQDWDLPKPVIIMGLKDGTLESLVEQGCSVPIEDLSSIVCHHMLKATDFLSAAELIHRDLKPANILYVTRQGQYHFQLGDLGFCHRENLAITYAGSPLYMAPEMIDGGKQTHKVDVWSLFVTMLWTLDVQGYRRTSATFRSLGEARDTVLRLASSEIMFQIREMAKINPEERASAAQMLVKCFNGAGLTTPRHLVPPMRKRGGIVTSLPSRDNMTRVPQAQLRQPYAPVPKKHLGQAKAARTLRKFRIPGGFSDYE